MPNTQTTNTRNRERLFIQFGQAKSKVNAVAEQAEAKVSYYSDLVWLARVTDEQQKEYNPNFYEKVRAKLGNKTFAQFMKDAENLSNLDNTQWHHGFNSGVFAAEAVLPK